MWFYSVLSNISPSFLFDSGCTVIPSQTLWWYNRALHSITSNEILYIDICITIWFISKWSVKDTDGQPGSIGSGPTNFIPTAAYSECITIPLSRLYLTLWMCHVHRDSSFWISLMQHSQTSVEPHIHLKKKCHASTFANSENPSTARLSCSCKSRCDCCSWPMCRQTVAKVLLKCPCIAYV